MYTHFILLYIYFLFFSEEEISTMKLELDKYGINMPSFGKIGGILANEVTGSGKVWWRCSCLSVCGVL